MVGPHGHADRTLVTDQSGQLHYTFAGQDSLGKFSYTGLTGSITKGHSVAICSYRTQLIATYFPQHTV